MNKKKEEEDEGACDRCRQSNQRCLSMFNFKTDRNRKKKLVLFACHLIDLTIYWNL